MLIFLLSSCKDWVNSNKQVQNSIIGYADSYFLEKDSCTVDLSDITSFKWDKLFLFDQDTSPDDISEVLGFTYNSSQSVGEDKTRMIFTLKNHVVKEEDFDWGFSKHPYIEHIDLPIDTTSYSSKTGCYTRKLLFINRQDAIFKIKKISRKKSYLWISAEIKFRKTL